MQPAVVVAVPPPTPSQPAGAAGLRAELDLAVQAATRAARGIGSALLRQQVTALDTAGPWTLQTSIFPENRASLTLHHTAGYRTVGIRERIACHHGRWRDTVLLERRGPNAAC